MFLSDLYNEKDEIQESIDLVQEIIAFAPSRGAGSGGHYQSPDIQGKHSHIPRKARIMYPGNNGVLKRAEHHLMKAQEKLSALDPSKDHDAQIYQEVIQSIRKIKDILIQYKGSKS